MEKFVNFDCPVCFEGIHLSVKIYQCTNGHVICEACSSRLKTCPQCRVEYHGKPARNLFLEGILDDMSYDCPYRPRGCLEKLCRQDIKSHESSCLFGKSFEVCKFLGADFTGCIFKLTAKNTNIFPDHLMYCHPELAKSIRSEMNLQLKLQDRRGMEGYLMKPFPNRDNLLLLLLSFTTTTVGFTAVDISLGLSVDDDIRLEFSVPDEKTPPISWQITLIPGIQSWKFMEKDGRSPQLKIDKQSILQHEDEEGVVKMNVQVKSNAKEKGPTSSPGAKDEFDWANVSF